ncbi:dynein regulatory complex protein 1-like [Tubulanus polymorphus]|uniref:dynein regulatory complex protein 1-like n=1 Tax=Tubulanus polymorphus TaxID=672921 RepID=UPI003DA30507
MSSSGEEEETGPSVDSNDPEERIAARRGRIAKRSELERRAARGEEDLEKKEVKELSKSRKQIEESRTRLTKLKSDGTELVTNIRVAGDARESSRRIDEEEIRRLRKEKLEAEAKAGTERFDDITKKWELALQKDVPQELHEMLMQQKASCDGMIDEKNKLINEFQMELKQKDDQYVKDLKKQAEDIDLMVERMEEQIKNLMKAYREELNEIENAFVNERKDLLETDMKKWEQMMGQRRDKELDYMSQREKRVDDYAQQLQQLRVQDAEEYNMVKIKLETDVQILEQQLQQMRATYQLNQEKLEYNFQVLKKRDEENTITKSQQKRKITRLQDVLNNLKIKLAKQEKLYKDENQSLMEDYKRITEQFKELQKKSKHFISTDAKKFHDIWCMNEAEAKDLVRKAMEENRIIHEHQLGLPWSPPDLQFLENTGPIISEASRRKQISANQVIQEVMTQASQEEKSVTDDNDPDDEGTDSVKSEILTKISAKTIKRILELICDEAGFLVESKLKKLLKPLDRDEQSLMRLDAIFNALCVDTEDDIHKLIQYFLLHSPKSAMSRKSLVPEDRQPGDDNAAISEMASQRSKSEASQRRPDAADLAPEDEEGDEELTAAGEDGADTEAGYGIEIPLSTRSDTTELIHPNEVIKALRAFVEDNKTPSKDNKKSVAFKIATGDERDDSDDSAYWSQYANILPAQQEKLWDALLDGMEKYSETLTARASLINETDALRQQNAELRMLLHQYVNSKVNAELEIPPTRVLQLDFNKNAQNS